MKLIVGLGNPGEQYQASRHNLGFLTIDYLAARHAISLQRRGCDSFLGQGRIGNEAVFLAKPQTFMNLSGVALEKLLAYYRTDIEDLLVIHDDLDLPFQIVRLKKGGGGGGHKGLASIIEHLGNSDFFRVRIGIGKPARKGMVESYVLSPFTAAEQKELPNIITAAGDAAREIVENGIESAMRIYNGKSINLI
ncbi:MAG: aminoacyl-tRNA hydrolase [Deltaproteobacteria bacterium]|nr:aminoacyl-tRNA hydrolase [Deltaproteobacteria bacterium]